MGKGKAAKALLFVFIEQLYGWMYRPMISEFHRKFVKIRRERREPRRKFLKRQWIELVESFVAASKKKEEEWKKLPWKWRKEWNCWGWNSPKSHNRRTWSIGHDLTRKFRHVRIDRCISVHGLFPFNPAALQVRESSCRGEPHFAIERTSQPSDHQPSLPCLAYPPTHLYTRPHTHTQRRVYEYIYTKRQVGRAHPPT